MVSLYEKVSPFIKSVFPSKRKPAFNTTCDRLVRLGSPKVKGKATVSGSASRRATIATEASIASTEANKGDWLSFFFGSLVSNLAMRNCRSGCTASGCGPITNKASSLKPTAHTLFTT